MKRNKNTSYEYSPDGIRRSILKHARSIKMPPEWAGQIADKVVAATDKWIADKAIVTEDDLCRFIAKELEELSPDLAYVYKNRDKII